MNELIQESQEKINDNYYLDASEIAFTIEHNLLLSLLYRATKYENVGLFRTFPYSSPQEFISVRDKDGNEIGIIRDLSQLTKESLDASMKELERRYFTPTITSIKFMEEQRGMVHWVVQTTAGERDFYMRTGQGNIYYIDSNRLMILDLDGNRYLLIDSNKIDSHFQKKIELLVN